MITKESTAKVLSGVNTLIGNTPLLQINLTYKGSPRTIYAKAENTMLMLVTTTSGIQFLADSAGINYDAYLDDLERNAAFTTSI